MKIVKEIERSIVDYKVLLSNAQDSFDCAKNTITIYNGIISGLEKELKKAKEAETKKFYLGDKFATCSYTYVLATINNNVYLVNLTTGGVKHSGSFDIEIQYSEDNRAYCTTLPTSYVGDFNLESKYAGKLRGW